MQGFENTFVDNVQAYCYHCGTGTMQLVILRQKFHNPWYEMECTECGKTRNIKDKPNDR